MGRCSGRTVREEANYIMAERLPTSFASYTSKTSTTTFPPRDRRSAATGRGEGSGRAIRALRSVGDTFIAPAVPALERAGGVGVHGV